MMCDCSFKHADFEVCEVTLSDEFKEMYDCACEVWHKLIAHPEWWKSPDNEETHGRPKNVTSLLWSAQQVSCAAPVSVCFELRFTTFTGMPSLLFVLTPPAAGRVSRCCTVVTRQPCVLQRFFGQMIMASKVPEVVELVKTSLAQDMCCVIGLQNTGEAGANSSASTSDDLFSNAANVILNLVAVCVVSQCVA